MKKFISMLLALSLIFCMTALTACGGDDDEEETNTSAADGTTTAGAEESTEADTEEGTETEESTEAGTETEADTTESLENTPNHYAYDWESINGVEPASVDWDWGAPDAESQYFVIDTDHVIHDGKGTWESSLSATGEYVFDQDIDTYYDCDEYLGYTSDSSDTEYGIILYNEGKGEDWTSVDESGSPLYTGYVGAYIEEGVVIHQIRYYPRSGWTDRMLDGYFEASVDGETWTTLFVIENAPDGGDFEMEDVDDGTVYYYVRYVCETGCYCNIAEFEIWGVAGTAE